MSDAGSPPSSVPSTPPSSSSNAPIGLLPSLGIATLSLGSCDAGHTLPDKLRAASQVGFHSVELFDNDWYLYRDQYAESRGYPLPAKEGDLASREAARELGTMAREVGIEFSCFQPLRSFEGYVDEKDRREAREHAQGILDVMGLLGTELLLVCSTTTPSPQTTGDLDTAVKDLTWLADLAATYSPPIRIMYEGLSFGAHRRRWQDVYEVVETANRPNLGLCLDSFNTLALEWADPYQPSGRLSDDVDERLEKNMAELVRRVPGDKVSSLLSLSLLKADSSLTCRRQIRSSFIKSPTGSSCRLLSLLLRIRPSHSFDPGLVLPDSSLSRPQEALTSPSIDSPMPSSKPVTEDHGVSKFSTILYPSDGRKFHSNTLSEASKDSEQLLSKHTFELGKLEWIDTQFLYTFMFFVCPLFVSFYWLSDSSMLSL